MSSKTAIVHEWFESFGGAEVVAEQIARLSPASPIFTLWSDLEEVSGREPISSFLSKTSLRNHKALSLPAQLLVWRHLDPGDLAFEKLIVSSHLFAHHARFKGSEGAVKFAYIHTPARYIWEPNRDKRGDRLLFRAASMVIKPIDRHRAKEVASFAANSKFTQNKIQEFWQREAEVIYPPVGVKEIFSILAENGETSFPEISQLPSEFILGASRFVEYKKLKRVIEIGELLRLPVVLAGSGPLLAQIKSFGENASVPVTIIERPRRNLLFELMRRSSAFIFPPIEDFGIMPVEASACGTPVIANYLGGAAETVLHGVNGFTVDIESDSEVKMIFSNVGQIVPEKAAEHALLFDTSIFNEKVVQWARLKN